MLLIFKVYWKTFIESIMESFLASTVWIYLIITLEKIKSLYIGFKVCAPSKSRSYFRAKSVGSICLLV